MSSTPEQPRKLSCPAAGCAGRASRRGSSIRSRAMSSRRRPQRASISRARSTMPASKGRAACAISATPSGPSSSARSPMCWSPTAPRYEEIAIANSGNTKTDAAIDIDGGIGTLKYYARLGAEPRRGAHAARREAGAARQGRELSGHPPDGAAPRRRHPHQRLQFPELGPVGEGGGVAAGRRAGARQAGVLDRAARARDGART